MSNLLLAFIDSNGIIDASAMIAYFQQAIDWGIEAAGLYLSFLAAIFLVVRLFSSR